MSNSNGNAGANIEQPARVVESFGRRVMVRTGESEQPLPAELFGKRLSCVCGDHVRIRLPAAGSADVARVIEVTERHSLLQRTDSRGRAEALAANLTLLAVVIAPQPVADPFIADRYLAAAHFGGIQSALIVNKSELPEAAAPQFQAMLQEYRQAGYPVLEISALGDSAVTDVRALLEGASAMLVGQSGVGKSTLTNRLAPASSRLTRTLSDATGEGRHTSVSTALFQVSETTELIDSPGVRDFAPPPVEDAQVQVGWPEILTLAGDCRFNNCLHLREPGCAVTAAVKDGAISARRYESYKRLVNLMRTLAPEYQRRR